MIGFVRRKLQERRFLKRCGVEERGIAFLTEGHTGSRINLRYEVWLESHPIAMLQNWRGDKGLLYNDWDSKYCHTEELVRRYVSRMLKVVPNGPAEIQQCEHAHVIQRYEPGSYDDYLISHRRPGTLVLMEWEKGDWVRPDAVILEKYPELEKLVFTYELVDDLSGDLAIINRSIPEYQSYSVVRDTAYKKNDRIGSVAVGLPGEYGGWVGRNLFKQHATFDDRAHAADWVALSSLGGWRNVKEYFRSRWRDRCPRGCP